MKKCLNCGFENPPEASYCAKCRFTLDWASTVGDDPTLVVPPAEPGFEMAIGPVEARAAAGGRVTFQVRLVNRGAGEGTVEVRVAGPASGWAQVEPRTLAVGPGDPAAATVTVAVPHDARPGTTPVEVYATAPGGSGASVTAQATLVVEPSGVTVYGSGGRGAGGLRTALVTLGSLAAVAVVVVAGVLLLSDVGGDGDGGDGGGGGEETGIRGVGATPRGACVHTEPNADASSRIPPFGDPCEGIEHGQEFRAECVEGSPALVKIASPEHLAGRWVLLDLVRLDGDPPSC